MQPLQVTAAPSPAITGPKTVHQDLSVRTLIDNAFRFSVTPHFAYAHTGCGQQIVDVPMHFLRWRQMTIHSRLEIAKSASGIKIESGREIEDAQTTDRQTHGFSHVNQ